MNKRFSVQNALDIISSDQDPNYHPSKTDMKSDDSSGCDDSDRSESNDLDEVPQPNMNPGQQNTIVQRKKTRN